MAQKVSLNIEKVGTSVTTVAACVERALRSHDEAEQHLRRLQLSQLPAMGRSLERAAADMESLHLTLSTMPSGGPLTPALRSSIQRLGYTSSRVGALFAAAQNFHAGLALVRATETGGYDALGEVNGVSEARLQSHRLEMRG